MSEYFLRELKAARDKYSSEAQMHKEKSRDGRDYFGGFSTAQNLFVAHIERILRDWYHGMPTDNVMTCRDCQLNFTITNQEQPCPKCGSRKHFP